MKRRWLFFILLPVCISNIQAQRDYRKGYIITNQQDTVYGWIDYRGDIRNSKVCSFKKTETEQATEYSPFDIAAYRFIDNKYYMSRNISNTDTIKQVFLEYLVNGIAKLFYYRDDVGNDLYFIENDGRLVELKIDKKDVEIFVNGIGIPKKKTINSYIGVLKATLNVWEMNDEIDRAKLDHPSLINIARNYHQLVCTDGSECIVYEKKNPLITLRIAPVVGADVSMLKLMHFTVEKYDKMYPSFNMNVGVNLNIWAPRIDEKIFLQVQAMYTQYYFFGINNTSQSSTDIHIRNSVLRMGAAIKYEYPKGKWRPTIAAGIAAIYMPGASIKEISDNYTFEGIRVSTTKIDFPSKFKYGFELIPGIHYYYTPKRIIFMQVQYMQCYHQKYIPFMSDWMQSIGLSAGIYF